MAEQRESMQGENPSTRYRLQFILGPRPPVGFDHWKQFRVSGQFLLAHPHLNIESVGNRSVSATLIGYILDPRNPSADNAEILDRLISSIEQGNDLFDFVYPLGGRWVLLVDDGRRIRLLGDAAGMRQIFYSDLGRHGELSCASQPGHIATMLELEMEPKALEFIEWFRTKDSESWWPGDSSPYVGVRRLLPNHYLDLQTGVAHRFWPNVEKRSRCLNSEVLTDISTTLQGMIRSAANRFELALAISAGWDSRLMLAASRPVADQLCYYSVKTLNFKDDHPDVAIPRRLAEKFRLRFDVIEHQPSFTPELAEALQLHTPFAHSKWMVPLQSELNFFQGKRVGATGNVSDIARVIYKRPADHNQPVNAEYFAELKHMEHPFAIKRFQEWLCGIGDPRGYSILDLFHWEQRVGSWFAQNCLQFDLAWHDIFVPFNSRKLLADMLSLDESQREEPKCILYRKLIEGMWPEALAEPINPHKEAQGFNRYYLAALRGVHRMLGVSQGKPA